MTQYKIEYAPRIEDQLKIIPKDIRKKIIERIDKLSNNPKPHGVEPLDSSDDGLFRIRQGDYRIVYAIENKPLLILVVRIVHRKEVYRKKHRT